MRRYFDLPDIKQSLMVEVKVGSPAALAEPEKIAKHFKQSGQIREIGKNEYTQLTKEYMGLKESKKKVEGKQNDA